VGGGRQVWEGLGLGEGWVRVDPLAMGECDAGGGGQGQEELGLSKGGILAQVQQQGTHVGQSCILSAGQSIAR
jgi:hypothetical protein